MVGRILPHPLPPLQPEPPWGNEKLSRLERGQGIAFYINQDKNDTYGIDVCAFIAKSITITGELLQEMVKTWFPMNTSNNEHDSLHRPVSPAKYTRKWTCRDGRHVTLRLIGPEDKPEEKFFIEGLSSESSRYRFFGTIKEVTPEMLKQFCDIDYEYVFAIMAEYESGNEKRNVGVGRLIIDPDMRNGEFAVVVADDFQNKGLGEKLLSILIDIGTEKKLKSIYGIVLKDNYKMLKLARRLNFIIKTSPSQETEVIRYL
jgi:RimJ/RimL family protein N-acetyltransferase